MEGLFADEGRTASAETAITRRPKPQFLTVGEGRAERKLCSTMRFHPPLAADYMLARRKQWVTVGELARAFYGANTPTGKEKIRRRMSELFNHLLAFHAAVLLYEFDGLRISAVKIHDATSEQDRQAAAARIDRMAKRCQWTQQQLERIQAAMRADAQV
jgi:hypothetical protein